MNLKPVSAVLEKDDHELIVQRDPLRGQRRALAQPFDLIVLDVQLPRTDGYTVSRTLRDRVVGGRIVALSSSAMPDQGDAGHEARFDAYLTKPISPAALKEAGRVHGGARAAWVKSLASSWTR